MADEALDLLAELHAICEEAADNLHGAEMRLVAIRRRLKNPDLPAEGRHFGHRVYEIHRDGEYYLAALAQNIDVAKAAFDALVKIYPHREWVVRWGSFTPAHYRPPDGLIHDPVPPRTTD